MKKQPAVRALVLIAALLFALSSARGQDAFLFVQGIPGESTDSNHKDWIDILAFSQGVFKQGSRASFVDFSIHKETDKSSPSFFLRAANGDPIPRATLELMYPGSEKERYYQIILSNCVVSAISQSGSAGSDRPIEQISLEYGWISWTYTEFDASGRNRGDTKAHWDLLRNAGGTDPPFRLTGTKEGRSIVVTWPGTAGTTYRVSGSPAVSGPYNFVQSVTPTSNGVVRLSFPIGSGNLFYIADTSP